MSSPTTSAAPAAALRHALLVLVCLVTPAAAQQTTPAAKEVPADLAALEQRVHDALAEDRWREALDEARGGCADRGGDAEQ